MSELQFNYAAMNSGKSTALINRAYSLREKDVPIAVTKPSIDTKGNTLILSRSGLRLEVDFLATPEMNIREKVHRLGEKALQLRGLLVDEAQFLQPEQVDQLFEIAKLDNIPVYTYGLRTDFLRHSFPGSGRLLELADSIEKLHLPAVCDCGKDAEFNTRMIDGAYVFEGDQVAIDGKGDVTYNSLCGTCYLEEMAKATAARSANDTIDLQLATLM